MRPHVKGTTSLRTDLRPQVRPRGRVGWERGRDRRLGLGRARARRIAAAVVVARAREARRVGRAEAVVAREEALQLAAPTGSSQTAVTR